jgi:amino acid permease
MPSTEREPGLGRVRTDVSNEALGFLTREELLGGLPSRRASTLLFAIESRTAHLVARSRQAMATFLTEKTAEARERVFLEALAQGRDLPLQPTIQDLERYAPEWADLVPPDAGIRATVGRMIGDKYTVPRRQTPALRAALGLDDTAVRHAYQRLHGQPLDSIFARRLPWRERLRWARSRLAHRLETLPPFWVAYALTVTGTIGPAILALPIAFAEVGPLAGVVVLVVLGLVNVLTIAAMAEAVARNGNVRYGRAYSGRLLADYFGTRTASILASIDLVLDTTWLGALVIGLCSILASVSGVPASFWPAPLFLICLTYLRRSTLNATVASSLIVGVVNVVLIAAILVLALLHVHEANLRHGRIPFLDGEPFTASLLGPVFGVVLTIYAGHYTVRNSARVVLPRDPSARSLMGGSTAGMGTALVLYCLWIIGVNGAVPPEALASESGTAIPLLAEVLGPVILVFGTLYGVLALGLFVVYCALGLFFQIQEWLPDLPGPIDALTSPITGRFAWVLRAVSGTKRRRFWLGAAPTVLAFLAVEGLILAGRGSFTDALGFLGVISVATLGGILPMLMGFASRRMGDYPIAAAWSPVGHPVVVAATCLLFLLGIVVHGLFIWDAAYQRAAALLAAVGTVALIGWIIRRGSFLPREVVELRVGSKEPPIVNVTARGEPVHVDVRWATGDGATAPGAVAVLDVPPVPVAVLKVWTHRLSADGLSEPLAARVTITGDTGSRTFDLNGSSGQAQVLVSGEAHRLEITPVGDGTARGAP